MEYKELKSMLDSYSSFLSGAYPHRYICFDMANKNNKTLFEFLEKSGYWVFAPNRSKKYVYYHMIVNFFHKGRLLPAGSGDSLENNHLDGNTMNNNPSNLIYMSSADHSLCTKFQRKLSKIKLKHFYKLEKNMSTTERTQYNQRGKLIRNWTKWIIGVICVSCSLSHQWVSYAMENLKKLPPIIDIVKYIEKYLKKINWKGSQEEAFLANLGITSL
jgi:hypothetical protein